MLRVQLITYGTRTLQINIFEPGGLLRPSVYHRAVEPTTYGLDYKLVGLSGIDNFSGNNLEFAIFFRSFDLKVLVQ